MSPVVAIDISSGRATLVAAERGEQGTIDLLRVATIDVSDTALRNGGGDQVAQENTDEEHELSQEESNYLTDGTAEADVSPSEENNLTTPTNGYNGNGSVPDLENLLGLSVDSSLAVVSGKHVLYKNISLPFANPKKIEQTAPLQVQDSIPFDIDDFIIDHVLLGRRPEGDYEILSTLIPEDDVADILKQLRSLGADPKILTTKAAALTLLGESIGVPRSGAYGLLEFSGGRAALSIFVDGAVRRLRDFPAGDGESAVNPQLLAQINCTLARTERDLETRLERIFVVALPDVFAKCREHLLRPLEPVDFSTFVRNRTNEDIRVDNLSWAIGLIAGELAGRGRAKEPLVDFRKGKFAQKAAWKNIWNAVKSEIVPIGLALFFGIGWGISSLYNAHSALNDIEQRIDALIAASMPGEAVPQRREVSYIEDRVLQLEEQLRGMGSLSSLSPLDSLKELSSAIGTDIDIQVDVLNIGQSRLTFSGSVLDNPNVGRLNSALESRKRFCEVNVEPKGREPGSGRVKFNADIGLCE